MKTFTAWIDPGQSGNIPDSIELEPMWISVSDRGGSYKAEVLASGSESALWNMTNLLGRKLHIYNNYGEDVWRGIIVEINLSIGGLSASFAYESMFNRIRVLYSFDGPDGQPGTGVTEWADDTESQGEHKIREYLHSMADTFQSEAEKVRDDLLEEFSEPRGVPDWGAITYGATISAVGVYHLNEWRFYDRIFGRFEHSHSPTVELNLGWHLAGSGFTFIFSKLHDINARLDNLTSGNEIVITGNTTFADQIIIVSGDPSGTEQETRSGSNIWLDPSDEIYINAPGNWDGFRAEEVVQLSGTASHNSNYAIEDVDQINNPQYLDVAEGFKAITSQENDQGTITITVVQGTSVEVNFGELGVDDPFTETLTIEGLGQEVQQSFVSNFTGEAQLIAISAMKVGTPVDNLRVAIYDDSGGVPGTQLQSVTVSPDDLATVMEEIWVELPTPADLTSGNTYWIVIDRTGANSHENLYRIGFTEDVILETGSLRLLAGVTYYTRTDMSLSFMVYATEDTVEQMQKILAVSNQHGGSYSFVPSTTGVRTNPYADGRQRASTLLEEAMNKGISGGNRLIVKEDSGFNYIVCEEPDKDSTLPKKLLWSDGRITSASGGPVPRGFLPVGEWVEIAELPYTVSKLIGEVSPVYIQEANLNLQTDDPPRLKARRLSVKKRIENI
jgi:hypothetical protein